MISKVIEATNGFNWGKFLVQRFDQEWSERSKVSESGIPLLRQCGWGHEHIWVLDLQTGEGACFRPGGLVSADLGKHKVWVCPMFEPFLGWLYRQDLRDLGSLPPLVELTQEETREHEALAGYRRPGVQLTPREQEVLELWLYHLNDKEVAAVLGTKEQTVRNQMASIEDKFGAKSKLELLRIVLLSGTAPKLATSKKRTQTVA